MVFDVLGQYQDSDLCGISCPVFIPPADHLTRLHDT